MAITDILVADTFGEHVDKTNEVIAKTNELDDKLVDGDKGDITVGQDTNGMTLTVDANAITTPKVIDGAITDAKLNISGDKGDITVGTDTNGLTMTVDSDAITTPKILDANVTLPKLGQDVIDYIDPVTTFSSNFDFTEAVIDFDIATIGNTFTPVNTAANPYLAVLDATTIAFIDNTDDNLRTYSWNGTDWSIIGNALSVPATDFAITRLTATTIAVCATSTLATYSWDGTDWSIVGNALSITSTFNNMDVTTLDATTIALINGGVNDLTTYSFDGTDWASVGNVLNIDPDNFGSVSALDATTIAYLGNPSKEIRMYSWDGTDWSQLGTGLSVVTGVPTITFIGNSGFSQVDVSNGSTSIINTYLWNGSTFTEVDSYTALVGQTDNPAISYYDGLGVITGRTVAEMKAFSATDIFSYNIEDLTVTNNFSKVLYKGAPFTIADSTANDGTFTVSEITDDNNIKVIQPITVETTTADITVIVHDNNSIEFRGGDQVIGHEKLDILTSLTSDYTITQEFKEGTWSTAGGYFGGSVSSGGMDRMSVGRLIVMDGAGAGNLRVFDYDEPTEVLSQTGSTLSTSVTGTNSNVAGMSSSRLAIIDPVANTVQAYSFDETTISTEGSSFAISASEIRIASMSSTRCAISDAGIIKMLEFNGATWSQVGNNSPVASPTWDSIKSFNSTDVVVYDSSLGELEVHRFDGTDWAKLGNTFTHITTFPGATNLTIISSSDLVIVEDASAELIVTHFSWDGTDFTHSGVDTTVAIGNGAFPRTASPIDYHFSHSDFSIGYPVYKTNINELNTFLADDNLNGKLGTLVPSDSIFDLTGTGVIDGTYSTKSVTDNDTVLLNETLSPQSISGKIDLQINDGVSIIAKDGKFIVAHATGWELISSVEANDSTSLEFTYGFTDDYLNFKMIFDEVLMFGDILLQVSHDAGATYQATTSDYSGVGTYHSVTTPVYERILTSAGLQVTPNAIVQTSHAISGNVTFLNLRSTAQSKGCSYDLTGQALGGSDTRKWSGSAVYNGAITPVDAIKIHSSLSNITGTVYLYGLRK